MHNVRHTKGHASNLNEDKIFNACRANPTFEPRGNVTFRPLVGGNFEASLSNDDGVVVCVAEVDQYDA
jgi:hypothetical protein